MNFDGNAPQYSAFAIVAIESVWPNPDGNEIPPDTYDVDLLRKSGSGDYSEQIGQGSYERSGFQIVGSGATESETSYQRREGYYKILPLNVIKVDTRSTREGSEFTLSFTLDDLLLVTDSDVDSLNATGLPMQVRDLVHLSDDKSLPILFEDKHRSNWEYKQDSELGLSRYKINGASSSFNIEDLVSSNDTVTIWIYHDPSDFYLKDKIPNVVDDADLHINDEIKNIVGSADRRNQFSDDNTSFEEFVLGSLGLINKYVGENITTAQLVEDTEAASIDVRELPDILKSLVEEASSGTVLEDTDSVFQFVGNFLTGGDVPMEGYFTSVYDKLILPYFDPLGEFILLDDSSQEFNESGVYTPTELELARQREFNETGSTTQANVEQRRTRLTRARSSFDNIILGLDFDEVNGFSVPDDNLALVTEARNIPFFYVRSSRPFSETIDSDLENLAIALTAFKNNLEQKVTAYIRNYIENKSVISSEQSFSHGRKVLINDFSGETPYLALKGKIASVSVSVGTSASTHTVTLSGQGYEKTLNETEIFYEDMLYPSATSAPQSEYMSSYGLMTPPRAMVDIVNRYAAKQVILGKPTDFTQAAYQAFLQLSIQLNQEDVVEGDAGERVDTNTIEGGGPMQGRIPLRGSFVLAEFTTNATMEDLRIFHPVNYIDTTRVSEMARVLDRSYEVPQGEAVINTAVFLTTRTSLMQNLKSVGGIAEFYELFVDETGRLRYRLSFEAMERTPKASITPIIQDEMLLSGASFTRNDALVKTMVDVRPITGQHNFNYLDLGFVGRSVASSGALPIRNATDKDGVDIRKAIAPDLYRYGFRSLQIQDIYTSETQGASRKANLYRLFYEKPLKQAHVNIINNTSYRVGDTALIALQRNKHRSRTLINLKKTRDWLNYLGEEGNEDLLDMYVGVDERLLMTDSYIPTASSYHPIPSEALYGNFRGDGSDPLGPKKFVLQRFIETFDYLIDDVLSENVNIITPDYFPPTYWYYKNSGGDDYYHWDEGTLRSDVIIDLYTKVLKAVLLKNQNSADALTEIFNKYPGIIQALKFHDFRAASYYIESVAHKFAHGKDATTQLALNHGQDNLVLLEPKRFLPIGFISIEKRMRIGYDSPEQQRMFYENEERSALQNMYLEQFREESEFRSASFMYRAQELRNASNYMHTLARREGISTDIDIETSITKTPAPEVENRPVTASSLRHLIGQEEDKIEEYTRNYLEAEDEDARRLWKTALFMAEKRKKVHEDALEYGEVVEDGEEL